MATEDRVCLPEHLNNGDVRTWLKRHELRTAANKWNQAKKLLQLSTLFKGQAWAIFESLGKNEKGYVCAPQGAMTEKLNPDTNENHMAAHKQLMLRQFREECESVDELARDLERLLDKSSPGLPAEICEAEL